MAERARPTAAAETTGRLWSNAAIARNHPWPSFPRRFAFGTLTSLKVTARVSEAR